MAILKLTRTRDNYQTWKPRWEFFLNSYLGGYSYTDNKEYLIQHLTNEDPEEYSQRLKHASYNNKCYQFIHNIKKHIYGDPIQRDGVSDLIPLITTYNTGLREIPFDIYFNRLACVFYVTEVKIYGVFIHITYIFFFS